MRRIILVGLLLLGGPAFGQISVPAESPEWTPIPVTIVSEVPEGARMKGPGLTWPEGVNVYDLGDNQYIVAAKPGTYTIRYQVSWLHIVPVTFTDGEGKEITIMSYLGDGDYDTAATFIVTPGEEDDDDDSPDPPIPPVTAAWGLILEETGDRSAEWGRLRTALRLEFDRMGKRLLILDETKLPSSLSDIKAAVDEAGVPVPTLIAVTEDGQAAKIMPCPDSVDAVKEELGL